ncbi:tetratricopeptide repeat protein [Bacteriovorax sp. BSW11_IV]|uniref:tetratricopeptide repeat protein n=1 Tax=Bacteriovorax sp. BSW11_IV TaxID=1353529 RepID=UPI00038A0714|nr:tetratricopeptide repeat protein [Bacteriovorax sp. BSW11_IV]EQC48984.1 tetratricopeptide repeat protein [Bacteriovorax sp. BSW11_IV]
MNTTTQMSQQNFDGQLQQTELGSFIARHKGGFLILVIAIVFGIIGYGIYSVRASKAEEVNAGKVFAFSNTTFKDFKEGKVDAAKVSEDFAILMNEVGSFNGAIPTALEVSDALLAKGLKEDALKTLVELGTVKNVISKYFVNLRLAAIYEDLGQTDKAIISLEELLNGPKLLEEKVYLDLGRLYLAKGDKDKARRNFEYVEKNMAQEEFKKLAKYYLSTMN